MSATQVWQRTHQGVVGIRSAGGLGSGWVALPNGLVVTNLHVVGYDPVVSLHFFDGRQLGAKVVYADAKLDIAFVVANEPLGVPPLPIAKGSEAQVGYRVFAVGHPHGLAFTMTEGIISALEREDERGVTFLQTDAPLNPGNSGGPLVSEDGRVLGVNTRAAIMRQNIGFAVPVKHFVDALRAHNVPVEQLQRRTPVYCCVECSSPYSPTQIQCNTCGVQVRFAEHRNHLYGPRSRAHGENVASQLLQAMSWDPVADAVGPGAWRRQVLGLDITAALDGDGESITFRTPIVELPKEHHEPFFRFLLTLNDVATGSRRLAIDKRVVTLSLTEPIAFLYAKEVTLGVEKLASLAGTLRPMLNREFGAPLAKEDPERFGTRLD